MNLGLKHLQCTVRCKESITSLPNKLIGNSNSYLIVSIGVKIKLNSTLEFGLTVILYSLVLSISIPYVLS